MNQSLRKSLNLLEALAEAGGRRSLQAVAAQQNIPLPTAWRIAATLEQRGFFQRGARGRYLPGAALQHLAQQVARLDMMAAVARPVLARLSVKFGCVAHLGTLEDDMVTYRAREGSENAGVPTKEGTQLEAYCSAIGKMLLAEESAERIDTYLGSAPFVPLTRWTITDPQVLRAELKMVAKQGYAVDAREVQDDLNCIALPVRDASGIANAAISLSQTSSAPTAGTQSARQRAMLRHLRIAAIQLTELMEGIK